jgi:hypothetical protein
MTGMTLDPFGYWPAQRSRVRPLGGSEKPDDANYVFHTTYAALPAGQSVAEISFDALAAETGMIGVRIFQHLPSGIPAVTEQGKTTALLPSIAKTKRSIKVPFEALDGATYAVTGYVYGECEARATAIDVSIAPLPSGSEDPSRIRSMFGRLKARHVADLATASPPALSWPVSQGFTIEQTCEPDFARITSDLPAQLPAPERWENAYIIRVLEQYGRLDPGARGLALSMATDPAATHVAKAGGDVRSIILSPGESIADACARQLPAGAEARGFDYLWTRSDVFGAGGSARAIGMIEELLERLRPGGLGIHLVRTGGEMDRDALNRVALGLAALGQIVAQLRYPAAGAGAIPFGFVVRKSTEDIIA